MEIESSFFQSAAHAYETCKRPWLISKNGILEVSELGWFIINLLPTIFGTKNFDLIENTNQLSEQGIRLFNSLSPPLSKGQKKEVLAAATVFGQTSRLIFRRYRSSSEQGDASFQTCQYYVEQAVTILAREYNRPAEHFKLKAGLLNEAYVALVRKEGLVRSIKPKLLCRLFPLAVGDQNKDFMLRLIECGAFPEETAPNNTPVLSLEGRSELAKYALDTHSAERNNDCALSRLIDDGCEIDGQMLLTVTSRGMELSLEALLRREDVCLLATDIDGNGALHRAYLTGNSNIIRSLSRKVPQTTNRFGWTPLMTALSGVYQGEDFCRITGETALALLVGILPLSEKRRSRNIEGILKKLLPYTCMSGQAFPQVDLFELAFLLENQAVEREKQERHLSQQRIFDTCRALREAVLSSLSREETLTSYMSMKERYVEIDVNTFFLKTFSINPDHLKTGCLCTSPTKPPNPPVPITTLLDVFDSLEPSGEKRNERRNKLERLLFHVENKTKRVGVPEDDRARKRFYQAIELRLQHIASIIKTTTVDPNTVKDILDELIKASPVCGQRYSSTTLDQYLRIQFGSDLTPLVRLQMTLGQYRRDVLELVLRKLYPEYSQTVHLVDGVMSYIGEELGIPGYTQVREIRDDYFHAMFPNTSAGSFKGVTKEFFSTYTPENILANRFLLEITSAASSRELYIDLHKEFTPWKEEEYAQIRTNLKAIIVDTISKSPEIQAKDISAIDSIENLFLNEGAITDDATQKLKQRLFDATDAFLKTYDIIRIEGQSPVAAIQNHQQMECISEYVFDEDGNPRFDPLVILFERLGIITPNDPKGKGKEKASSSPPVQRQGPDPQKPGTLVGLVQRFLGINSGAAQ